MKTKNMKIAYSTRYSQKDISTVPKIQMEGKWLEELGFSVGSTIAIEYEKGSIRIRPLTEEEVLIKKQQELEAEYKHRQKELRIAETNLSESYNNYSKVAEPSGNYGKSHITRARKNK